MKIQKPLSEERAIENTDTNAEVDRLKEEIKGHMEAFVKEAAHRSKDRGVDNLPDDELSDIYEEQDYEDKALRLMDLIGAEACVVFTKGVIEDLGEKDPVIKDYIARNAKIPV